jgi:SAM-dependent methyltransferase
MMSDDDAHALIAEHDFVWHQRFQLSPNVWSPGHHDIEHLLHRVGLPPDLSGASVLDIGTTNGGAAFVAERRGATVTAVDIFPPTWFGFDRIAVALGSRARFVEASVYELADVLGEKFDLVLFLGVLYHLRHPLLAIDALHRLARAEVYVDTEVATGGAPSFARFFPGDEHAGDASNWFVPTLQCLIDWFTSSGFDVNRADQWPAESPSRGMVVVRPHGEPRYQSISYERPIRVHVG